MNDDALASSASESTFSSISDLVTCFDLSDSVLLCTAIPTSAVVPTRVHDVGHPPVFTPHVNSPPHVDFPPSPRFLSLHQNVPTMESLQPMQQLEPQYVYHQNQRQHLVQTLQLQLAHSQQQREQLQLQLEWHDQRIQCLLQELVHYLQQQQHTQHSQQSATPQTAPPCRQEQQLKLIDNAPQLTVQSSPLFLSPIIQDFDLTMVNCITEETKPEDRVDSSGKTDGKRPQKRLTDEQSRDIISLLEGDDPASYQKIANKHGCSKSTVWRHRQKFLQTKQILEEGSQ